MKFEKSIRHNCSDDTGETCIIKWNWRLISRILEFRFISFKIFLLLSPRMGYNGKHCILRALCESTQYFYRKGSNMVEELIRTVFSLPMSKVLPFEHNSIREYDLAHRKGRDKIHCPLEYPCSFSLIELALGAYSDPLKFM